EPRASCRWLASRTDHSARIQRAARASSRIRRGHVHITSLPRVPSARQSRTSRTANASRDPQPTATVAALSPRLASRTARVSHLVFAAELLRPQVQGGHSNSALRSALLIRQTVFRSRRSFTDPDVSLTPNLWLGTPGSVDVLDAAAVGFRFGHADALACGQLGECLTDVVDELAIAGRLALPVRRVVNRAAVSEHALAVNDEHVRCMLGA